MQSLKQRSTDNMKKETFGNMVAVLRKERGMTQLELTNLITNHTLIKTKEFKTILKILDIKEEVLIR